ncbi:uncharacterized protein LOC133659827 isoform X1 [Entelurus aequoreus]|uniref:uncharacterized protein LOC133659827 isoform X1 n=1 Tax=Entelurus aequoreus TaxID=161455 RepID=UPI002B1E39A0|nr:uncharacterized protein LOC133659827 isoform X1 [Entelurus aequoreus]
MAVRLFEESDHAAAYLQYRVTPQEIIDKIMDFMKPKVEKKFNLAVDVGCGCGQGTVLLAPFFDQVVGTDISPAQLHVAQANSARPNVTYRQCPAEELPFESNQVDLLAAMTAAHWFDRQRFLKEADRVLKPGGCLALLSYMMDMELEYGDATSALNNICEEFYAVLRPFRNPCLDFCSLKSYLEMFESCSYTDKEWNGCLRVKRTVTVNSYMGMVETFTSYRKLKQQDAAEAKHLSDDIRNKLLGAMQVSSPEMELTMVFTYFYILARKL